MKKLVSLGVGRRIFTSEECRRPADAAASALLRKIYSCDAITRKTTCNTKTLPRNGSTHCCKARRCLALAMCDSSVGRLLVMYADETGLQKFIRRHNRRSGPSLPHSSCTYCTSYASEREPRAELERESVISLLIFFGGPIKKLSHKIDSVGPRSKIDGAVCPRR